MHAEEEILPGMVTNCTTALGDYRVSHMSRNIWVQPSLIQMLHDMWDTLYIFNI